MLRILALLCWIPVSSAFGATSMKQEDFAYGVDIAAPADGPVFKLNLSEEIYRGIRWDDLRDLRVFNSQGQVVPHSLQHQLFEMRQSTLRQPIALFPIDGRPSTEGGGNAVEIREDASGKVVQVRFSGQDSDPSRSVAQAYLLDLRMKDQALKSLEFDWTAEGDDRIIPVSIEASEDLKSWRPISSGNTIAKLAYQGESLEQKRIEVPEVRARYLKVTREGDAPFKLQSVQGEFVSGQKIEATRNWSKVTGSIRSPDSKHPNSVDEYGYDTGALFSVDSLRVRLPELNMFVRVRVSSSDHRDGPWQERYSGTVYRVLVNSKEVTSPVIQLNTAVADRYWKLAIESKEANLGERSPELEMGWVSHQLLFLARGTGPFRLAYGSASAGQVDFAFPSLLEDLKSARGGQAVEPQAAQLVGGQKELGGASRLSEPVVPESHPWKRWALWVSLGLAMLIVAAMAWRLYAELSEQKA